MNTKVYCINCKHSRNGAKRECGHPYNIGSRPVGITHKLFYKLGCDNINRNNNCKWYLLEDPIVNDTSKSN